MKHIVILIASLLTLSVSAQQDIATSQYMFNGMFLNPAVAGTHDGLNMTLVAREQWVNMEGAPSSQIFTMDAPVYNNKMGVGLNLTHDRIGVSKKTNLYANYAYHLQVGEDQTLSFGMRAGVNHYRANLASLTVWDESDPEFMNNQRSNWLPNFGAGVYLHNDQWYAGLSVPTILSYDSEDIFHFEDKGDNLPGDVRHYYLTGGYSFILSKNLMLQPSTLLRYVDNAPLQADLNLNALIHNVLWLGGSYRTGDYYNRNGESIVALAQFQVKKNFRAGYSYDFPISKLQNYHAGSHELTLSYDFVKDIEKIDHPRYF